MVTSLPACYLLRLCLRVADVWPGDGSNARFSSLLTFMLLTLFVVNELDVVGLEVVWAGLTGLSGVLVDDCLGTMTKSLFSSSAPFVATGNADVYFSSTTGSVSTLAPESSVFEQRRTSQSVVWSSSAWNSSPKWNLQSADRDLCVTKRPIWAFLSERRLLVRPD